MDAGLAETRQRLAAVDALIEVLARPERRLVHYEAGARRTLAAVSVGDLDGADRVAVVVPGAGTTVAGSIARHDGETAALVTEAGALSPSPSPQVCRGSDTRRRNGTQSSSSPGAASPRPHRPRPARRHSSAFSRRSAIVDTVVTLRR